MRVAFVPTTADSLTLARELPLPVSGGDVVLARSDLADPGLPALLGRRGAKVRELVAYRTVAEVGSDVGPLRHALDRGSVTVVVASPSAVDALVAAIGRAPLRSATFVAIGERTARAVHDHVGVAALVADATDSQALIRSIAPLEEVMP
jgi:uroporphyrinogen-III synthase